MSAFEFVIPANTINSNPEKTVVADRGLQRQVKHRILTSKFGDGYEQRVRDGINTKEDSFNISFNNRPAEEINLIAAFLDAKAGLNFNLTITNYTGDEVIKVVAEEYNISYPQETIHSLQTTFRRVYEP
jgi:phage-related protein